MSYTVENLSFSYTPGVPVLERIDFSVEPGHIVCILGPSGCGKSTLFKVLAGLLPLSVSSPAIGKGFNQPKSYLFQEPRLFGHLTAKENIAVATSCQADQIDAMLEEVGLYQYRDYFPSELSGGMQQRLAAARAFLYQADLMFLDEPFKSLDYASKIDLIQTFKALFEKSKGKKTALMITHDALDAALLGDEIIVLSNKPTRVVKQLKNPVSRLDREPTNPDLGLFLSQLFVLSTRPE